MRSKLFKTLFSIDGISGSPFFWAISCFWIQLVLVSPYYFFAKLELEQEFANISLPPQTEPQNYASFSSAGRAEVKGTFKTELSPTEIRRYYHQVLQELGWQYIHVDWNDYYCKGNFTTTIVYETSPTPFYRLELATGRLSKCEDLKVGFPLVAFAFSDMLIFLGCSSSWLLYILYVLRLARRRKPFQNERSMEKDSTNSTIEIRFFGVGVHVKSTYVSSFYVVLSIIMILASMYSIGHYLLSLLAVHY